MEVRRSQALGALTIGLIVAANLHITSPWSRLGLALALTVGIFAVAEGVTTLVGTRQHASDDNDPGPP
jgi:hypothetical protein